MNYCVVKGKNRYIALAKNEPFTSETPDPIREPGELWFAIADTPEQALAKLKGEMTNMTFGYIVKWKEYDGTFHKIEVGNYPDPETAKREALAEATRHGWTPRKWWEWWRWDEESDESVPLPLYRRMQAKLVFLWIASLVIIVYWLFFTFGC